MEQRKKKKIDKTIKTTINLNLAVTFFYVPFKIHL